MDHAASIVISLILLLCTLVLEAIGIADGFLATAMTHLHINPQAQTALLIGISLILIIAAIRSLGRVLAALIIVLLVLMVLHKAMPNLQVPHQTPPAAGTVHV